MHTDRKHLSWLAVLFWSFALSVLTGCQHHERVVTTTPQQQQTDVDSNTHIPPAQKAAIKAQIAREAALKAQPTPPSAH